MIANARMYSVTPAAAVAWRALLGRALAQAGLDWEVIEHAAPALLADLWRRDDLGCVLMCGYPFAKAGERARRLGGPALQIVAAPLPAPVEFGGRPLYWTELVVRGEGPIRRPEHIRGGRIGYTAADSQSGYQAPRHWLARTLGLQLEIGVASTEATLVGPLITPRRVVEAVLAGEVDVGPVDAYALALLRAHEAALVAPLRTIARTVATALPLFVASPAVAEQELAALRAALLDLARCAEAVSDLQCLLLAGFAIPPRADYDALLEPDLASTSP